MKLLKRANASASKSKACRVTTAKSSNARGKFLAGWPKGLSSYSRRTRSPLLKGTGRVEGAHRVSITADGQNAQDAQLVEADRIMIATGSKERTLPGLEIDGDQIITSYEALTDTEIPESILIVGGGAIGCEFAYIYSVFGSRVTVVEMESQLLPGVDAEIAQALEKSFKKKGIEILTGTKFHSIEKFPGRLDVQLDSNNELKERTANKVLVAVGRVPLSTDLGLEELGIEPGRGGYIPVNEQFQTSCESIYAIGDITGPPLLAHAASEEGVAAVECMVGQREKRRRSPTDSSLHLLPTTNCRDWAE